jgi:hypothetical protein
MVVLMAGVSGSRDERSRTPAEIEAEPSQDLGWLSLVGVLLAGLANGWLYGVVEVGSEGMVAVDGFRLFANWVFLAAAAMGILVSFSYVHRQRLQAGEFYGLILLATAGMMFMVGARDLIVVFLGLEVMSVSVYALTAFNRRDKKSAEAGLKYFLLGAFATGFLLYGIALTYGATGSTNVAVIGAALADGPASPRLLAVGIAMLAIGFGFKVSAVLLRFVQRDPRQCGKIERHIGLRRPADGALGAAADDLQRFRFRQRPLHGALDVLGIAGLKRVGHCAARTSEYPETPPARRAHACGRVRRSDAASGIPCRD